MKEQQKKEVKKDNAAWETDSEDEPEVKTKPDKVNKQKTLA